MSMVQYRVALNELAQNLWWSWDATSERLWRRIDAEGWETSGHNPVALLQTTPLERWRDLDDDPSFRADVLACHERMNAYLNDGGWCKAHHEALASSTVAWLTKGNVRAASFGPPGVSGGCRLSEESLKSTWEK